MLVFLEPVKNITSCGLIRKGVRIMRYVLIQIWSFCAGRKTSCGEIFAYVSTENLAFVDYLRTAQKIHLYRIGVCA